MAEKKEKSTEIYIEKVRFEYSRFFCALQMEKRTMQM